MARRSKIARQPPVEGPDPFAYLAQWREAAGMTQETVAERLNVTGVTVHRWENGKPAPSVDIWTKLAALYGATHPTQLMFPPAMRDKAAALEAAWSVIATLPPDQLARWIGMGEDLRDATRPKPEAVAAE